jgi:hypothetical protein
VAFDTTTPPTVTGAAAPPGQRAGAADLDVDGLEPGPGQFGRELVRDGPARRGRAEAEPRLQRQVVDLVDDAVDVIAERARCASIAA